MIEGSDAATNLTWNDFYPIVTSWATLTKNAIEWISKYGDLKNWDLTNQILILSILISKSLNKFSKTNFTTDAINSSSLNSDVCSLTHGLISTDINYHFSESYVVWSRDDPGIYSVFKWTKYAHTWEDFVYKYPFFAINGFLKA